MNPPFSLTAFPRRVMAVAALSALPPLALTAYAVGPLCALLWVALATLLVPRALRGAPKAGRVRRVALALWVPTLAVMLVWAVTRLPPRHQTGLAASGPMLFLATSASVLAMLFWEPFLECLRACKAASYRTFPHGETDLLWSAVRWCIGGATSLSIVSDEPLWCIDALVCVAALSVLRAALRREELGRAWLAEVAAGTADAWQLQTREQVQKPEHAGHAALVERVVSVEGEAYRSARETAPWVQRAWVEAERIEGQWVLSAPRARRSYKVFAAGVALCAVLAGSTHGYLPNVFGEPPTRSFVIDRPPPDVVHMRGPRLSLPRFGGHPRRRETAPGVIHGEAQQEPREGPSTTDLHP